MEKLYKIIIIVLFSTSLAKLSFGQSTTFCDTASAFCTGQTTTFPASTNTTAPLGPNYGCLGSQPNPAFFFLQIDNTGPIIIDIGNSANVDVDFICWGPFTSLPAACASGLTGNSVDCSYSAAANETCDIPNAQNGDVYVLMITNYSGQATNISFTQNPGSTGTTDCSIVNNCSIQNVIATPTSCLPATNTYSVSGAISYINHPTNSGSITITDVNSGISQTINAPFGNTINYTLTGINPDALQHTINVAFNDSINCIYSVTYTAPVPCCPQTPGNNSPVCKGDVLQLWTDTIAGANYSWTGPGGFTSSQNNPTINSAQVSHSGVYTVTVSGACNGTGTTTVVVNPRPVLTLNNFVLCQAQVDTLKASVTAGTPPYTYVWDNGLGNSANQPVVLTDTTEFHCQVTDVNGCTSNLDSTTINVYPPLQLAVSPSNTICEGNDTLILAIASAGNGGPYNYLWSNGLPDDTAHIVAPLITTTYYVTATDNCSPTVTDSIKITVIVPPMVSFTSDTSKGCMPLPVNFTYTGNGTFADSYLWQFGDGTTSVQMNPSHYYADYGCYDVTLTAYSAVANCPRRYKDSCMIDVYPQPAAEFSYSPNDMNTNNPYANFNNLSSGDTQWYWDFDDGEFSLVQAPTHTYADSGTYNVLLVIQNTFGCIDSMRNPVRVDLGFNMYVPNSFTPNNDGKNDIFGPVAVASKSAEFTMYIFDRWGDLVYKTSDVLQGWNGSFNNSGPVCPEGVYSFRIFYKTKEIKSKEIIGTVNLIR